MKTRKVKAIFPNGMTMTRNIKAFSAGSAINVMRETFNFGGRSMTFECEGVYIQA